ncbi:MAG: sensor histidine kinase [Nitriliruptor sp.]
MTDQGPGVPDELHHQLFERFARGPTSHGTGLGLAIVRGLARANAGDVAYAHDTRGSSFSLTLPAAASSR